MLIQRFNPTDHFRTMDMLFDALMPTGRRATHFARKPARSRLTHHEDRFVLEAELPGLSADQLELEVGPDFIELSAKRELEIPEGYTAIRSERSGYSFERRISGLIAEARALDDSLGEPAPWSVDDRFRGPAYAVADAEQRARLVQVARLSGLILDPVYTGKAMAGLLHELNSGELKDAKSVLFLHTGGAAGLFGYPDLI